MYDELSAASPFADVHGGSPDFVAMNKGVTPIFWVEPVKDEKATEEAGTAKYREMEMVRIVVAGDMLSAATSPVDERILERFGDQYRRWKQDRVAHYIEGTPLRQWSLLSPSQVLELKALNIESVEQLAAVADSHITKIQDGRVWREKARGWLLSAQEGGAAAKLAAENERLRQELERRDATIEEQSSRIVHLERDSDPGVGLAAPRGRRAA